MEDNIDERARERERDFLLKFIDCSRVNDLYFTRQLNKDPKFNTRKHFLKHDLPGHSLKFLQSRFLRRQVPTHASLCTAVLIDFKMYV